MDISVLKLGLGDWFVAGAFYLNIAGAAVCVLYAGNKVMRHKRAEKSND